MAKYLLPIERLVGLTERCSLKLNTDNSLDFTSCLWYNTTEMTVNVQTPIGVEEYVVSGEAVPSYSAKKVTLAKEKDQSD